MSLVETSYEHIIIDDNGAPVIAGANMKVIELVLEKMAYGWSAEELHFQHPYLTLGQIHSALAYYWDHREEIDDEIERRLKRVDEISKTVRRSPAVERLRSAPSCAV